MRNPCFGDEVNANPAGYLTGLADGPATTYGTSTCEIGGTWMKSTSMVNNGNWHNIVITLKSGILSLYIDNVLNIQKTGVIPTSSWVGVRRIGVANYSFLAFYNGVLDDIAIYNRALTQFEVTSLYFAK